MSSISPDRSQGHGDLRSASTDRTPALCLSARLGWRRRSFGFGPTGLPALLSGQQP